MGDIFDYLQWRGDVDMIGSPFNEIDNLILSRISYFPFECIIDFEDQLTLKESFEKCQQMGINEEYFLMNKDYRLFKVLAECNRFCNLKMGYFIHHIDFELEQQFGAIVIYLPNNTAYISYRGTDSTLVGWKEDFNMTFLTVVPSQKEALHYLSTVGRAVKGKLILGGHSKGGNISIYAAMYCEDSIQDRIETIYNNDGPGFVEEIVKGPDYEKIADKIRILIPQTSIIGRLLNSKEDYLVVKSNQKLLLQHDLYSWQLKRNHLIYMEELDKHGVMINKIMSEWLNKITMEEREQFVNSMYYVLGSTNIKSFKELDTKWYKNTKRVINTYKNARPEDKVIIGRVIDYFFKSIKENLLSGKKNK